MCQCPVCYELFSGESTFVLHRIEGMRVNSAPGKYWLTECRDPASKGMKLNAYGVWGLALKDAEKVRARGLGPRRRAPVGDRVGSPSGRHDYGLAA